MQLMTINGILPLVQQQRAVGKHQSMGEGEESSQRRLWYGCCCIGMMRATLRPFSDWLVVTALAIRDATEKGQ